MKYNEHLTFDDVLIVPKFSSLLSRKEVDLTGMGLKLPVISANMDTITGSEMSIAMAANGGLGVLHRFWSIEDNINALKTVLKTTDTVAVSIGITDGEKERVNALIDAGAKTVYIDVAHGAQVSVANQVKYLKEKYGENIKVVAGNFATSETIKHFCLELNDPKLFPDAFKVGIGPGSVCTTRIKTGVGVPQLYAIMDCSTTKFPIIADGGMRTPGDIAKALSAGASAAMLGGMLAGTKETPGEVIYPEGDGPVCPIKVFRGSASKESYEDQNKTVAWRTTEGITTSVPFKGSVVEVLNDIEGGLRSAFTYVGAKNLKEFQHVSSMVKVSTNSIKENHAHIKG